MSAYSSHPPTGARLAGLTLAALGVVYGDIGTSPLYAFKEAFVGSHAIPLNETNVLATLSILFWAVMLIVSLKYVWIVLAYDNEGEGGVLALTALAHRLAGGKAGWSAMVILGGIFAAALFYGDAVITPAISVLSAIEGLSIAEPALAHWELPLTVAILVGLFLIQRHGTGNVGRFFGPVTVVWFLSLGTLGAVSIAANPGVLRALDPSLAVYFAAHHHHETFLLLSAVFLALTGGEALYADMGHFGARPVRVAWYGLVLPALMLNYFGQGALVLRDAHTLENPFYLLAPESLQLPLVVLATAATVIASQATISGAYSLTLQASQLGYLPRVRILHTSETQRGQIYVPAVNWLMLTAVVMLVLEFRSAGALAAAYGIAVSGTMIITTVLTLFAITRVARRGRALLMPALVLFLGLEMLFFASNLTKFAEGGWLPMVLGMAIFLALTTWKRGTSLMAEERRRIDIPMLDFLNGPAPDVPRIPGTAVYLTSDPGIVPSALFHNLKHFKVMHESTVFLHVQNLDQPRAAAEERLRVEQPLPGVWCIDLRFGFREEPDIPAALAEALGPELVLEPMTTTYFVARSSVVDGPGKLGAWRCAFFSWMLRQAEGAATYYRLPPNQVVELGTQVML